MKAKISASLAAMLLALGLAVGCSSKSGSNSSDAQIIGEVTTKVQSDASVQTKAIAIQSANGIVTLSGQVASDAERSAIASDAAQVQGVKTVVNNLTVASAAAQPAPAPAPVEASKPEPVKSSARHHESYRSHGNAQNNKPAPAPAPSNTVAQTRLLRSSAGGPAASAQAGDLDDSRWNADRHPADRSSRYLEEPGGRPLPREHCALHSY